MEEHETNPKGKSKSRVYRIFKRTLLFGLVAVFLLPHGRLHLRAL